MIRPPLVISLAVALTAAQVGCAHQTATLPVRPAPLSEPLRAELGTIGVATARFSPDVDIRERPAEGSSGSDEAAGAGVVGGAAAGGSGAAALLPYVAIFPPIAIAAGAVLILSTTVGAIVGAISDATTADSVASLDGAEAAFKAAASNTMVQIAMRDSVLRAARRVPSYRMVLLRDYGPSSPGETIDADDLARSGADSLLLVEVDDVTMTADEGANPEVALDMVVRSTLVRAADGDRLDQRSFRCRGGKRSLNEWNVNGSRPFDAGLSQCYEKVADRLVEELFLVYEPPQDPAWSFGGKHFASVVSDSLRPAFEWGEFHDRGSRNGESRGALARIHQIAYDLKIWRADSDFPGELTYAREGLQTPYHRIERPLEPSTQYFWTVRARFEVNGEMRVTPWAVTQRRRGYSPKKLDRVTNDFYYRFTTPSDAELTVLSDREPHAPDNVSDPLMLD